MRILVIELYGFQGHKNINSFFLRCLKKIGDVTFVAPTGYLTSPNTNSRIDIPQRLLHHQSKLGAHWSAFRVLDYVLKHIELNQYDTIIFLAYETISFSIRWPQKQKTILFEHNNIDNIQGSMIKSFFYRRLSQRALSLTFQNYIKQHIQTKYKRQSEYIPHPYYRSDIDESGTCEGNNLKMLSPQKRILIFSPSGSTPRSSQDELKNFVTKTKGDYYAICKGSQISKTQYWETSPFFENYENIIKECDFVFLGAHFNFRVSGVAYEALSYGTPIILFPCTFAKELQKKYPHLVFIISALDEILTLKVNIRKSNVETQNFLQNHSFNTILSRLKSTFK